MMKRILVAATLLAICCCSGNGQAPAALDAAAIPELERFAGQPKELVAILGSSRGRYWTSLTCLSYSPDGKQLACGTDWGAICIYDAATLRQVLLIPAPSYGHVLGLAYSPKGDLLASLGRTYGKDGGNGEVKLWEMPAGKLRATIDRNIGHFWSRGYAFDGQRFVSAGEDNVVRCWDVMKDPPRLQSE